MLPGFVPEPLRVTCNSCGASAETWDGQHPNLAFRCGCCPAEHDHDLFGCRPVTIAATAVLRGLSAGDVLDAIADATPESPTRPALDELAHDRTS